jgi:diacylglycerol kinase family enzyme
MVRKVSRAMMFRLVPEFMKGTHPRFARDIRMGTCRRLSMSSDKPLYIHADGEILTSFGSNLRRLTFEVLPGAIRVVRG